MSSDGKKRRVEIVFSLSRDVNSLAMTRRFESLSFGMECAVFWCWSLVMNGWIDMELEAPVSNCFERWYVDGIGFLSMDMINIDEGSQGKDRSTLCWSLDWHSVHQHVRWIEDSLHSTLRQSKKRPAGSWHSFLVVAVGRSEGEEINRTGHSFCSVLTTRRTFLFQGLLIPCPTRVSSGEWIVFTPLTNIEWRRRRREMSIAFQWKVKVFVSEERRDNGKEKGKEKETNPTAIEMREGLMTNQLIQTREPRQRQRTSNQTRFNQRFERQLQLKTFPWSHWKQQRKRKNLYLIDEVGWERSFSLVEENCIQSKKRSVERELREIHSSEKRQERLKIRGESDQLRRTKEILRESTIDLEKELSDLLRQVHGEISTSEMNALFTIREQIDETFTSRRRKTSCKRRMTLPSLLREETDRREWREEKNDRSEATDNPVERRHLTPREEHRPTPPTPRTTTRNNEQRPFVFFFFFFLGVLRRECDGEDLFGHWNEVEWKTNEEMIEQIEGI